MMVEVYSTRLRAPGAGPVVEARAPDVQSGFNAVAGALSDAAQTLRRADQASQLTDARRTVLEGYAAAEADLEKDQDWLGMEGRQNERLIKIREEALGKIGYESLRDDFALDLDRQGFAHIGNVRRRAFGLQKDHTLASLDETLNLYRERAAKLDDPMALNALLDDAGAAVSDVREGGFIDELQARRLADGLETGVFGDFTARLVERDPQGALRVLETPGALPIDEQTRLTALTRAQGEIDRRRAKAEAEEAKRELSAERALNEINAAALNGLPLTDERQAELLTEISPAGQNYISRANAAIRRTGLFQQLANLPPAARAAMLEGWRQSGGASSDDTDWFGRLQQLDQNLTSAEERERAAALREVEQERKQLEREARAEARTIASERRKTIQDFLGAHAQAQEDGATFAHEEALGELVRGTEFEAEYDRNRAVGDLWSQWRAAPPEGKAAIEAQIRAMPVSDKRGVQLRRDMIRETDQELDARDSALKKRADEHFMALSNGAELADFDAFLQEARATAPDLAMDLNRARASYLTQKYAAGATSSEIRPFTPSGGAPLPRSWAEAKAQHELEDMAAAAAKMERTNPLGGGYAQGVIAPIDLTDPTTIRARIPAAQHIAQRIGPQAPLVLTERDERAGLKAQIEAAPVQEQAQIWTSAAAAAGPYAPILLRELDAPASILWTAEAAQSGVPPGVVAEAARGAMAIKSGSAPKMPSADDQRDWTSRAVGDLFGRSPDQLGRLLETTKALYAARAGLKEEPDRTIWTEALQAAMGANGDRGGVREVAGRLTPLPPSVSASEAVAVLDRLAHDGLRFTQTQWVGILYGGRVSQPIPNTTWRGITSNGAPPSVHGVQVDQSILDDLTLRPVSGGRYLLEFERRGQSYPLEDPATGAALTIRLEDLVK